AVIDLVRARFANLKQYSDALAVVRHDGLRGRLREILTENLIAPFLPPAVELLSGTILGADGEIREARNEDDVVVFDQTWAPLLLKETKAIGYQPIPGQTPCPIQGVCILGRGSWFLTENKRVNLAAGWYEVKAEQDRELLAFVSILSNAMFGNERGVGTHVLDT